MEADILLQIMVGYKPRGRAEMSEGLAGASEDDGSL